MGLDARLRNLESKVIAAVREPAHSFDLDRYLVSLGLVPSAVRELAHNKDCSLVEAMCEMLGVEPREFKRELQEAANRAR